MSIYFFGELKSMSGIKLIILGKAQAELLPSMIFFFIFDIWDPYFLKTLLKSQNSYLQILENKTILVSL